MHEAGRQAGPGPAGGPQASLLGVPERAPGVLLREGRRDPADLREPAHGEALRPGRGPRPLRGGDTITITITITVTITITITINHLSIISSRCVYYYYVFITIMCLLLLCVYYYYVFITIMCLLPVCLLLVCLLILCLLLLEAVDFEMVPALQARTVFFILAFRRYIII